MDQIEQSRIEEEMRDRTIARYHGLHDKAFKRGEWADTHTGRAIQNHVFEPFRNAITEWVTDASAGGVGRKNTVVKLIGHIDHDLLAYLFTKAMLNFVPMQSRNRPAPSLTGVAIKGASMIHDEIRIRYFEENWRALCRKMFRDFDKRDLPRRRRKEMVQRKFAQLHQDWHVWERAEMLKIGVALIDLFIQSTGMVKVVQITENRRRKKVVQPTEEMLDTVESRMSSNESLFTVYMPTVVPPSPWRNGQLYGGGYYTHNTTPYPLVKNAKRTYLEDLAHHDLTKVLNAINAIQETPWRVNSAMTEVVEAIYEMDKELAGLPSSNPLPLPPAPPGADEDGPIKEAYRRACYLTHDTNRRAISKRLLVLRAVALAKKFDRYEKIYFPHQMDSRGRLYPVPTFLNPQGPDFVKAILEFAEGKPIDTEEQACWLAIAGANAYGFDKATLQERVDWTVQNRELIMSCAADPLTDLRWTEASEPFQFLRFCFEWSEFDAYGYGFISHLPTCVDATCSGLQHFSAMLRDPIGGKAVNLTGHPERQDIYQIVADRAVESFATHLNGPNHEEAQAAMELGLGRKDVKRSVMVVPYSGTFHACMKYTRDALADREKDGETHPWTGGDDKAFIGFVSKAVWDAISDTVVAARGAMKWLGEVASLSSKSKKPLPMVWYTPDGFPVQQARYKQRAVIVNTYLDGSRIRLQMHEDTKKLDPKTMGSSVAPNFVHSLDAAHLRLSVLKAINIENDTGRGMMFFAMVHDSFGVHAADLPDFINNCVKPAFVEMYTEQDVLEDFREQAKKIVDPEIEVPQVPPKGELDLLEVYQSDFFFS